MSLDHLCKEGPAEAEDIEIPSSIIFIFTILLVTFYRTHNNVHIIIYFDSLLLFFTGLFSQDLTYTVWYFIGIWSFILTAYSHKEYHYWTQPWADTIKIHNTLHHKQKLLD